MRAGEIAKPPTRPGRGPLISAAMQSDDPDVVLNPNARMRPRCRNIHSGVPNTVLAAIRAGGSDEVAMVSIGWSDASPHGSGDLDEGRELDWLLQVGHHAEFRHTVPFLGRYVPADDHHRYRRGFRVTPEPLQNVSAVDSAYMEIQQNEVRLNFMHQAHTGLDIWGRIAPKVVEILEQLDDDLPVQLVVFDIDHAED